MEWRNVGIAALLIVGVAAGSLLVLELTRDDSTRASAEESVRQAAEEHESVDTPPKVTIQYQNIEVEQSVPITPKKSIKQDTVLPETPESKENRSNLQESNRTQNVTKYADERTYLGKTYTVDRSHELIYSCFDNNKTLGIHDGYERTIAYGYVDSHAYILDFIRPERYAHTCALEVHDLGSDEYVPLFNIRLEDLKAKSYNMLNIDTKDRENYMLLPDVESPPAHMGYVGEE